MSRRFRAILGAALLSAAAVARAQNAAPEPSPTPVHEGRQVRSPGNAVWAPDINAAHQRAAADGALRVPRVHAQELRRLLAHAEPPLPRVRFRGALDRHGARSRRPRHSRRPEARRALPHRRRAFGPDHDRLRPPRLPDAGLPGRARLLRARPHRPRRSTGSSRKVIDAQDVAHLPAADAFKTGQQLYARFDFEGAAVRLARAADAKDATPAIRASALEGLAAADLELGKTAESRRAIDRLIAATKDPAQKENAELFRAQISLVENKPQDALAAYRRFAKDHPDSPYIEKVKTFIARLEGGTPRS